MFTVRGEREELTGWRDVFSSGLSGQLQTQNKEGKSNATIQDHIIKTKKKLRLGQGHD